MKNFDQRWQMAAEQARLVSDAQASPLSHEFITRVLACRYETTADAWDELIATLGLRALVVTSVLCLVCGGYAFSEWYQPRLEVPVVDSSLTSDLVWP